MLREVKLRLGYRNKTASFKHVLVDAASGDEAAAKAIAQYKTTDDYKRYSAHIRRIAVVNVSLAKKPLQTVSNPEIELNTNTESISQKEDAVPAPARRKKVKS